MAEHERPVDAVEVSYGCDKCREGSMIFTGKVLTSHPPFYEHRCNKCGEAATYRRQYPCTVYRYRNA